MHAELLACYETIGQAIWLKNFISRLRVVDTISKPLMICCDNQDAVFLLSNNKQV